MKKIEKLNTDNKQVLSDWLDNKVIQERENKINKSFKRLRKCLP